MGVPLWLLSPYYLFAQVPVGIFCMGFGFRIFSMWPSKLRQYSILMERNKNEFHPESFEPYMGAPCGRKLTHVVLKDLGEPEKYKILKKYKPKWNECCVTRVIKVDKSSPNLFVNMDAINQILAEEANKAK